MRVGTRITVATSALVVVSLLLIGIWDLRRQADEQRQARIEEAQTLAFSLRAVVELQGVRASLANGPEFGRELARAEPSWSVTLIPVDSVTVDTRLARRIEAIKNAASTRASTLVSMVKNEPTTILSRDGDRLIFSVPLRLPNPGAPRGFDVAGVLEVSQSLSDLGDAKQGALIRAVLVLAVITAIVFFAVLLFTRGVVTRPIAKLLAGVDDVAKGDLSHAVLSEREDEIGMLATRFNEMTHSLRESRAETARQNDARRGLEERLFQTEKLATIGQLAAEIAHEVGTPLNVISGRARSLGKKAKDTEAVTKNAGIIAEQSQRIARIIQRLLDFARRKIGHVEKELVDMGEIAHTTLEFLEGRLQGANVVSEMVSEDDLPPLRGQRDQLQQVVLNLLINAIEAMPSGGSIRVETSSQTRRRPGLADAAAETVVCVQVGDSGPGIPEEARDRIFEPFYTSKDREGGTGLGLAVSHGIVKEHDGWIEVDSNDDQIADTRGDPSKVGRGTLFSLYFPIASPASNPPSLT